MMNRVISPSTSSRSIARVADGRAQVRVDALAVEEPLEIRLVTATSDEVVTVTMRTPGADAELALGFLIAEQIIDSVAQVSTFRPCGTRGNVLKVELVAGVTPRLKTIARNFASTASCGLCGKSSLDAVTDSIPEHYEPIATPVIAPALLQKIPEQLRAAQSVFDATGGLHAVAAFSFAGELSALFEDVGRHNAFDKLVGATLMAGAVDLSACIVALSGRAGFELIQKAAVARVPIVVAIGAPSSLAVELAERMGITLIGFLRQSSFNVYTRPERVALGLASIPELQ
jgi:FdhD protein